MYNDPTPIEAYVSLFMQKPQVAKIIAGWRVEPSKLQTILVGHVKELGITFVNRPQQKAIEDLVLFCLKKSKEIKNLVKKAEKEETDKRRSRHADV